MPICTRMVSLEERQEETGGERQEGRERRENVDGLYGREEGEVVPYNVAAAWKLAEGF